MQIENLKINFLGDSITQGSGASSNQKCYVEMVARRNAVCRNYGIGGTRIAVQRVPTVEIYDRDFCGRYSGMDDDADVVAVFGGTNDFGHGDAEMGQLGDNTPDTFYGALNYLYGGLKKKYPDALIFVITPLHRKNEKNLRGEGNKPADRYSLEAYVKAIYEVAEYHSLPVLDLYNDSELTFENIDKYFVDGLHPNDSGHAIIADRIVEFIQKI